MKMQGSYRVNTIVRTIANSLKTWLHIGSRIPWMSRRLSPASSQASKWVQRLLRSRIRSRSQQQVRHPKIQIGNIQRTWCLLLSTHPMTKDCFGCKKTSTMSAILLAPLLTDVISQFLSSKINSSLINSSKTSSLVNRSVRPLVNTKSRVKN